MVSKECANSRFVHIRGTIGSIHVAKGFYLEQTNEFLILGFANDADADYCPPSYTSCYRPILLKFNSNNELILSKQITEYDGDNPG